VNRHHMDLMIRATRPALPGLTGCLPGSSVRSGWEGHIVFA
jgi:hypothetical protein